VPFSIADPLLDTSAAYLLQLPKATPLAHHLASGHAALQTQDRHRLTQAPALGWLAQIKPQHPQHKAQWATRLATCSSATTGRRGRLLRPHQVMLASAFLAHRYSDYLKLTDVVPLRIVACGSKQSDPVRWVSCGARCHIKQRKRNRDVTLHLKVHSLWIGLDAVSCYSISTSPS